MDVRDRSVYIVARDNLARAGLAAILADDSAWKVAGHGDGADLPNRFGRPPLALPDCILWDTGWEPDLAPLARFYLDFPRLPILALVAGGANVDSARRAGAAGVLSRSAPLATLVAALEAITAGLIVLDPSLLPEPTELPGIPPLNPDPPVEALTPRELDVLRLVAQGLPNKTIALNLGISEHTVKFHMNSILAKLNAQSRTEAVITAGRAGIIQV